MEKSEIEFDLSPSWNCYVPQRDGVVRIGLWKVRTCYDSILAENLVRDWDDASSC